MKNEIISLHKGLSEFQKDYRSLRNPTQVLFLVKLEGWTGIGIRCTRLRNYVELFWNALDNAPSYIVFYLEMEVDDIRSVAVHPSVKLN